MNIKFALVLIIVKMFRCVKIRCDLCKIYKKVFIMMLRINSSLLLLKFYQFLFP